MVADDPESFADLDGHFGLTPGACDPHPTLCEQMQDDKKKDPPSAVSSDSDKPVNVVKDVPVVGKTLNWLVDGDKIALASRDVREAETIQGKIGEGTALVLLVAINVLPGAGKAGKAAAKAEEIFVYEIVEHGKTVYVGITNNLVRRAGEHGAQLTQIVKGLTRNEAKAVEQALIKHFGLSPKGGQLRNLINSISPTRNPQAYKNAVTFGKNVLEAAGYHF